MDPANEIDPGTALPRFPVSQAWSHLCDQAEVRGLKIGLQVGTVLRRIPGKNQDTFRYLQTITLHSESGMLARELITVGMSLDSAAERMLAKLRPAA